MGWKRSRRLCVWLLVVGTTATGADAQTIDDALMMSRGLLCTGFTYSDESWSRYWEGNLQRDNGNLGTVRTRSVSWVGTYGLADRVNLIAMVPWVRTDASAGTLRSMRGLQDATVAAKVRLLRTELTRHGTLGLFAIGSVAAPLDDYTPDFYPMSIGTSSRRASARGTLDFQARNGLFLDGTGAYTWRGRVSLDRDFYFTNDRLYSTSEVAMPDVIDYTVRVGYWKHGLYLPVSFTQQITLGGSDIRRQDMPFVSNRMNASRVEGLAMYYLKRPRNFVVRLAASRTISGRNVGRSTTFTAGVLYTLRLH